MHSADNHPVDDTAREAAKLLQRLDPGNLAELRRMKGSSTAAPAYWRLAARHAKTIGHRHDVWMAIVRAMAILTPTGDPDARQSLHNARRRLGEVLCDGGDPGWPMGNMLRPVISERRLAQLMSARGRQRQVLLERVVRAIARTFQPGTGVDVTDIAWWLLDPNTARAARRLAESYYKRLDRADRDQESIRQGANT